MTGYFGPPLVALSNLEALDEDGKDSVFSAGDEIVVAFNIETNRGGLPMTNISKTELATVFSFSQSLGTSYVGYWPSRSTLRITILDPSYSPILTPTPNPQPSTLNPQP